MPKIQEWQAEKVNEFLIYIFGIWTIIIISGIMIYLMWYLFTKNRSNGGLIMLNTIINKRKCIRCERKFDQHPQIFCSSKCIVIDYFLSIGRCGTIKEAKDFAAKIFEGYLRQTEDSI